MGEKPVVFKERRTVVVAQVGYSSKDEKFQEGHVVSEFFHQAIPASDKCSSETSGIMLMWNINNGTRSVGRWKT